MGFVFFTNPAKRLCLRLPSPWRGVGGEALFPILVQCNLNHFTTQNAFSYLAS